MKPTPAKPGNSIAHVDGSGTLPTPAGETSRSQRADIPRVSKTIITSVHDGYRQGYYGVTGLNFNKYSLNLVN